MRLRFFTAAAIALALEVTPETILAQIQVLIPAMIPKLTPTDLSLTQTCLKSTRTPRPESCPICSKAESATGNAVSRPTL